MFHYLTFNNDTVFIAENLVESIIGSSVDLKRYLENLSNPEDSGTESVVVSKKDTQKVSNHAVSQVGTTVFILFVIIFILILIKGFSNITNRRLITGLVNIGFGLFVLLIGYVFKGTIDRAGNSN